MKKIIVSLFALLLSTGMISRIIINLKVPQSTMVFTESNKEIINPGRGFYVQIYSDEAGRFEELKKENIKVVLVSYSIKSYLNTTISKEKLQELETALSKAREYGIKVVFRAAYGFSQNYKDPDSIETVYSHIKQIAPVLNANKDVILSVQAGFIGPWGEWHNSKFFTGDDNEVKVRNQLLTVLLGNLDKDIIIDVRRPRFIRDAQVAGIDISRLGLHDDALLSTDSDMGTYDDPNYTREDELEWAKANIIHGVNGGEMPLVSEYSSIDNAVKEMKSLHITYLNYMYNTDVLKAWKNTQYNGQNGLEYVNNHLGYRFWLGQVTLSKFIKSSREFSMKAVIHNSGFAPISKDNKLFLVMKSGEKLIFESELDGELSSIDGGAAKQFNAKFIPANLSVSDNKEDILVGFYITNVNTDKNSEQIELANANVTYENGVNYFAKYKFENGKYVLEQ